jgi:hypothetical protein
MSSGPLAGGVPLLPGPGQPGPLNPGEFKSASAPASVSFAFDKIGPPSALYIQRDDVLIIIASSNQGNETVIINARFLLPQAPSPGQPDTPHGDTASQTPRTGGTVVNVQQRMPLPNIRQINTSVIQLTEGYLLSVAATANIASFRGQTFVRAILLRGAQLVSNQYQVLFEDYCTNPQSAGWPGGRQVGFDEGTGWTHSILQSNPPAGADWAYLALFAQKQRITSLSAVFTASAAVANRQVELIVDDGANILWRASASANVTAGQTVTFSATGTNVPAGIIATDQTLLLPPGLVLVPNWRIRTATTGIQAGDQWSNIWLNVEEWLTSI